MGYAIFQNRLYDFVEIHRNMRCITQAREKNLKLRDIKGSEIIKTNQNEISLILR